MTRTSKREYSDERSSTTRRRKQIVVLEISYVEELPTDDSLHTLPPSAWNWGYILNAEKNPEDTLLRRVIPKVVAAGGTEPDV